MIGAAGHRPGTYAAAVTEPRVIGIGASAGGIDALLTLLQRLPENFPHAVCVTVHLSATSKSKLADILDRRCAVSVVNARHHARLQGGCVFVAPPDRHLLVRAGLIELSAGPKENGVRPAVDPMLRSIAAHGPRSVAVVLSGALGDGGDGAKLVLHGGGDVFVQEPDEALVTGMPRRAIELVDGGATVLRAGDIGAALAALAPDSDDAPKEAHVNVTAPDEPARRPRPEGPATGFTCPECDGAIWETREGDVTRYRCRIGHSYSEDSMVSEQGAALEAALWSALEMLEERAELLRRVAQRRAGEHEGLHRRLTGAAADAEARADLIRRALVPQARNGDAVSVSPDPEA